MRRLRFAVVSTLALLGASAVPATLRAQFPDDVRAGARVRVWVPEPHRQMDGPARRQLLRGTVQSVAADTLHLAIPGSTGTVAIPRASVRRLQLSRGEPSRIGSAFERAVGGALGGAVTWGLMNDPQNRSGPRYRTDWQAAGVGAAWGAGVGAAIGLLFPHEQWRRVRLRG